MQPSSLSTVKSTALEVQQFHVSISLNYLTIKLSQVSEHAGAVVQIEEKRYIFVLIAIQFLSLIKKKTKTELPQGCGRSLEVTFDIFVLLKAQSSFVDVTQVKRSAT